MSDSSRQPAGPVLRSELLGDPDMAELLVMFLDELGPRIRSMEDAWRANDGDTLKRVAHQLKGAAGGYGYPTITEAAFRLESRLAKKKADAIADARDDLRQLVELCQSALRGRP